MKTTRYIVFVTFLVCSISVFAQKTKPVNNHPFAKGNLSFDLNRMIGIKKTNQFVDGNKTEKNKTDFNLQGMYFISKGLGIQRRYFPPTHQLGDHS